MRGYVRAQKILGLICTSCECEAVPKAVITTRGKAEGVGQSLASLLVSKLDSRCLLTQARESRATQHEAGWGKMGQDRAGQGKSRAR